MLRKSGLRSGHLIQLFVIVGLAFFRDLGKDLFFLVGIGRVSGRSDYRGRHIEETARYCGFRSGDLRRFRGHSRLRSIWL
jgi:hypothetical protein